jgi:hypothetical protein
MKISYLLNHSPRFWLASYLSLAASSCAEAMNSNALCGADWMALTADFAEVANAGAGIRQDRWGDGLLLHHFFFVTSLSNNLDLEDVGHFL